MKVWQSLAVGIAGGLAATYWLIAAGDNLGFREGAASNPESLIFFLGLSTCGLVGATWMLLRRARDREVADKITAMQNHRADPTLVDAVVELATKNGRKAQIQEELQAARIARGQAGLLIKDVYWLMGRASGAPVLGSSAAPWTYSSRDETTST